MKLVLDDVELHHGVAAKHGRTESQSGIVRTPIGPSWKDDLSFVNLFIPFKAKNFLLFF